MAHQFILTMHDLRRVHPPDREVLRGVSTLDAERLAAEVDDRFAPILRRALISDLQSRNLTMSEIATLLEHLPVTASLDDAG